MKQKINLTIKGEDLKKKLNIKDGKTPVKGVDYFDGKNADEVDYDKVIRETTDEIKPLIPLTGNIIKEVENNLETNLPKFGKQFRDGLELLDGKERLNKEAILGLEDYDEVSRLAREPKVIEKKIISGGGGAKSLQEVTDIGATTDNIITVPGVQINTASTPATNAPGLIQWNSTDGTYDMGLLNSSVLQVGQETMFYGKASGAIANGDLCQFAGVQGDHILIKKAVGSEIEAAPHYLVGVATENIANGSFGYVTWFGKINGIYTKTPANQDSADWVAGDILYFNVTTGQMTKTMPSVPNRIIHVAAVIKEQTGASENGIILVRPTFGQKLQDLDDVNGTPLTTDGQFAVWNNTAGYFDFDKNINDYLTTSTAASTYVPYTGATTDVDLGANDLTVAALKKSGATSDDVLLGDGTTTSLAGISTSPSGSNTQVQFNNSGVFGASSSFTWNNTLNRLSPNYITLAAGTTSANASPLKFTSGSLMTTAEVGGVEFLTDKFYGTITTGTARKEFTLNDISLTSGRVPYVTTGGRLTNSSNLTFNGSEISAPTFATNVAISGYGMILKGDGLTAIEGLDTFSILQIVGGGTYNTSAFFYNNRLVVGATPISTVLMLGMSTTREHLRLGYNTSNYYSTTVGSTGIVTFDAVGSDAKFIFSDSVDLRTGSATAGTYPLKFTSGALLTAPVIGVEEFLTDKRYTTISTGTARKEYALNDIALTTGRIPYTTTNGRLTDNSGFLFDGTTLTLTDKNIALGTTTGTKIGTATTQKIGFYNATPVVQQLATTDLGTVLSNLGLREVGTAYPITTSGAVSFTGTIGLGGQVTVSDSINFALNTTTGTKIGTATTQKLGFWNKAPVIQQVTNAYTSDGEGSAYTGIDNLQVGSVYAQVSELNQLRVAYETLRASYDDLLTKLKTTGIVA